MYDNLLANVPTDLYIGGKWRPATDKGRFDVTHNDADLYVFKVHSLRNVAMTPPYFHDGAINTLPEAVSIMAKVQLGKDLAQQDVANIVAFLGSLTGQLPDNFRQLPVLPPSAFAAGGTLSTGGGKH